MQSETGAVRPDRGMRGDIQGLRAIAVGAVLLDHLGIPGFSGGFLGVDVFFVVSGFLISGQLIRELDARGRVDVAAFYARRARRILPASLVVLVLTVLGAVAVLSPLRLKDVLTDAVWTALYAPNVRFAIEETDYLSGDEPSPFQHYWSLGVEEQFYLLWPALLIGAFALAGRTVSRRMAAMCALVVAASFIACVLVAGTAQPLAFFSLPTRAWELGAGALVALGARRGARVTHAVGPAVVAWAGLALVVVPVLLLRHDAEWPGWLTLLPVAGTCAVVGCAPAAGRAGPAGLLSGRPLGLIGRISYSLYLVHWPLLVLIGERLAPGGELPLPARIGVGVASLPLAWASWRFVERPFRRARRPARHPHRRLAVVSIASALVIAVMAAGGQAAVASRPLDAGRVVADAPLSEMPQGTPFVPSNIAPRLIEAVDDTGDIYSNGCQQTKEASELVVCDAGDASSETTVALFGDSHAGRIYPALARVAADEDVRLTTYLKSGCRSLDTEKAWSSTENASCASWRAQALDALAEAAPDIVVFADHTSGVRTGSAEKREDEWEEGVRAVIDRLPPSTVVVLLQDNPELPWSAPECLSSHLDDAAACAAGRDDALNQPVRDAFDALADGHRVFAVDLADWFCNVDSCPAVIGSTLVYSDDHHLTATFAAELADPLRDALVPAFTAASG